MCPKNQGVNQVDRINCPQCSGHGMSVEVRRGPRLVLRCPVCGIRVAWHRSAANVQFI